MSYVVGYQSQYHAARAEHAWLLRAEGLTYQQIANRLGVCKQRIPFMVSSFGVSVQACWRMRKFRKLKVM